jgi:hypothetical protein
VRHLSKSVDVEPNKMSPQTPLETAGGTASRGTNRATGSALGRVAPWLFRTAWAALVIVVAPAIGSALADNSRPVQLTGTAMAWFVWAAVLMVSLVPTCLSLTALRLVAPLPMVASIGAAFAGASAGEVGAAVALSLLVVIVGFSAELGAVFVQGSAYGDERRFALRPPGPLLLGPIPLVWSALAAALAAGPLMLAARSWIAGPAVSLVGIGLAALLGPRFHRLSLRWLVLVPAGAVIHDQMVLTETVMFRMNEVAGAGLAPAGTEAADLTGNALGGAVEVRLRDTGTVVLSPTKDHPNGRALHVKSFLISPSRPGQAIAETRRRGLPA